MPNWWLLIGGCMGGRVWVTKLCMLSQRGISLLHIEDVYITTTALQMRLVIQRFQ